MVNRVFTNPGSNTYNMKPRYRCLEDYATYHTHMLGSNGQEDASLPLIGEFFDVETEGGFTSTSSIHCGGSKLSALMSALRRATTLQ